MMLFINKFPHFVKLQFIFWRKCQLKEALTKTCGLAPAAPGDVGSDEEGAPQTTKYTEQDEGEELKQVPGRVVLHIEQNQAAVPKRVNGPKHECCHQGSEKGPP